MGDLVGFLQGPSGQGIKESLLHCLQDLVVFCGLCRLDMTYEDLISSAWYTLTRVLIVSIVGSGLSKGESPPEGESEEDVAGSTPCIDNGKASRGHTRCVKCGHSKNPSAKLQCTHCGAYLRDQTKARVAQRWAMLKEKAKREGRLGDKVWALLSSFHSL